MITQLFTNPLNFLIWFGAVVIVITIHEFAHAAAAYVLGDETARYSGRLTLNPLEHLDPLGTLLIVFSGFGWGKPVPVNPLALNNPMLGTTIVSLAGPASNLALATTLALGLRFLPFYLLPGPAVIFVITLIQFNLVLALFNLLPISPLDGFKVVAGLLPPDLADQWLELKDYGIIILVILLLPFGRVRLLSLVLDPPLTLLQSLLLPVL